MELNHLRNASTFCLLLIAFPSLVLAQLDSGPRFDATPVEIPTVEKTRPRSITNMDLLKLRDLHGLQISPDGEYAAFVLGQAIYDTNSYRSGLFVVGTGRGSKPVCLGSAGPPHWDDINQWSTENPQWSPDGKYIYYRLKDAGIWQVWRWNRNGGRPAQVTHAARDVRSFELNPNGTTLIMMVKKSPITDERSLAEHGILYDGSFDAVTPEPIVDRIYKIHEAENEPWLHNLQSGTERKAQDEELETYSQVGADPRAKPFLRTFTKNELAVQQIYGLEISPDRTGVVYTRFIDDFSQSAWRSWLLLSKPIRGGSPVAVAPAADYARQYWWGHDSTEIYYTEYSWEDADHGDASAVLVFDSSKGTRRQVLQFPGLLHDYSADRSGRFLVCIREGNTTPAEIAMADLSSGRVRTLVDLNPEFRNIELRPAKRIDVTNKYNDHFWGHLVLPPDYDPGQRYPLIITTYKDYGGFLRGGSPGDEYPIQVFAANGFAVLNFEALGKSRNSKPHDFDRTILFWQSPLEAMETAVTNLAKMGVIDKSRVGITGLSHGADVLDYGISHTTLFSAAIDSGDGSRDPIDFYLLSDGDRAAISRLWDLESPLGDANTRWQRISPALNASRIQTPLLINSADAEYIADMQFVTTLRDLKKPVEMFIYSREAHLKNQPKHRYEIYERNVDWFNFWLRDKEDMRSEKTAQYERWRELRKMNERRDDAAPRASE